jgi:hypothetical protein
MQNYEFLSFDSLLSSAEVKIINFLHDYDLLSKFTLDVKKVLLYFLVKEFNDQLHNRKLLIYHAHAISDRHELLEYYPKENLDIFFNKLCSKIKKITKRLFFITSQNKVPKKGNIHLLDGEIIDEIILMNNEEPSLKELKEFLHKHNLKDIFTSIHSK